VPESGRSIPIAQRSPRYSSHVGMKRSWITYVVAVASLAFCSARDATWLWNGQVLAASFLVFTSKCVGQSVPYPIPRHPIVTIGDSITAGYGSTTRCLPLELHSEWDGSTLENVVGNLFEMAKSVQVSGARPVLVTVLPVDRPVFPDAHSKVGALNTAIRAMGKQSGVRMIDPAARFLGRHPLSRLFRHAHGQENGVHPNDAGYQVFARTAATSLRSR
jgi:lysophospholipase L1-like esterase